MEERIIIVCFEGGKWMQETVRKSKNLTDNEFTEERIYVVPSETQHPPSADLRVAWYSGFARWLSRS